MMPAMDESKTIRGREVPSVGFGTWRVSGRDAREGVADALALGYRHIDTAAMYANEREVGEGLRESGVPREEVWITSKVWYTDLAPADVRRSAETSLRDLGIERLDLLLIHWPPPDGRFEPALEEMLRLREEGLVDEVGVSNFDPPLLRRALEVGPVFCDQVRYDPRIGQRDLLEVAAEHDVLIAAYSPLGRGDGVLLSEPVLREIGEAHGKTPAQVVLRYLVGQEQVCAIPRSLRHERRAENLDVFDFELSAEERGRIAALAAKPQADYAMVWA
jgi:2,5-diketo-D-gluconate reductase B